MKIPGWYIPSLVIAGYLHLPGMFQSSRGYQLFIRSLSSADLKVTPTWIEIVQTRNKKLNPCVENNAEYDQQQLKASLRGLNVNLIIST